jgi:hypothetical protein
MCTILLHDLPTSLPDTFLTQYCSRNLMYRERSYRDRESDTSSSKDWHHGECRVRFDSWRLCCLEMYLAHNRELSPELMYICLPVFRHALTLLTSCARLRILHSVTGCLHSPRPPYLLLHPLPSKFQPSRHEGAKKTSEKNVPQGLARKLKGPTSTPLPTQNLCRSYSSGGSEKRPIRTRWNCGNLGITTAMRAMKLMVK